MMTETATPYGATELRALYPRFGLRALLIASMIHVGLAGVYEGAKSFLKDAPLRTIVIHRPDFRLGPPPSLMNSQSLPRVTIAALAAQPTVGKPVPVPDAEVSPDATIPTQPELSAPSTSDSVGGEAGGTIILDRPIGDEREPDSFVAVEKLPVPIQNPAPAYPEIPRRAGIEGTVWVRIWVSTEGRPKKAEVIRTDSELFNQAAVDAAMRWVFIPAVMNNGPVAVWISIPFKFKLRDH